MRKQTTEPKQETLPSAFAEPEREEDLDIPAEALKPMSYGELSLAIMDADDGLRPYPETAQYAPVYRWEIPLDDRPGYVLPIEITEAASIEHARNAALAITIGADEIEEGRNLTAMEQAWVKSTEPAVVRDTTQVTLSHDAALYQNGRLQKENDGLQRVKRVAIEYGIDPENPHAWIDAQINDAALTVQQAREAFEARGRQFAQGVEASITSLRKLAFATGFATPEPLPAAEPDYSKLTVFTQDAVETKAEFPRLAAANFIEYAPGEEPSDEEKRGAWLAAKEDGLIDNAARSFIAQPDQDALKAFRAKVKAEYGV